MERTDQPPDGRPRPPATGGEAGGGERDSRSFVGLLALALRRRRLLVGIPVGALLAAVALSFVVSKEYTAQSRFMPEKQNELSGELAGMAAQLGIPVGGGETTESLDFYAQLLRSQELLRAAALTEYTVPAGRDTLRGTLLDLYGIDGDTPAERLKAATQRLEDQDMTILPHRSANVLLLRTRAPWPELAEAINRRLLTLVNAFNLERRQSRAAREREFMEARVAQSETELRAAERELEAFIESNRRYSEAPETSFRYARLQRRVDFLQQIHTSMAQGLEQARVEAIRNTPVVTVIDRPEGTALQTAPRPVVNGLLGLLLGLAVAVSVVLVTELVRGARRSHPREFSELEAAAGDAVDDLRRVGRLARLRRRGTRSGRGPARDDAVSEPGGDGRGDGLRSGAVPVGRGGGA